MERVSLRNRTGLRSPPRPAILAPKGPRSWSEGPVVCGCNDGRETLGRTFERITTHPLERQRSYRSIAFSRCRARRKRATKATAQTTGVTMDPGLPVETSTAQSKIEPGKKGLRAG